MEDSNIVAARQIVLRMLKVMRSAYLGCDNFHHSKADQHHDHGSCGPHKRFMDVMREAEEYLNGARSSTPEEIGAGLWRLGGGVSDIWSVAPDTSTETVDKVYAGYIAAKDSC